MKRLQHTPELISLLKKAVGEDVDITDQFAVFESITLNDKPLPGKRGTMWEGAVATPLTLKQIADHINDGNHIPLVSDHDLSGSPKGRLFHAGLHYGDDGEFELRTLFYLDPTEALTASKIDAGSLDEVSISFLPTQYQCSECEFDYLGEEADFENLYTRTCDNGHTIGTDGVHVRMIGLDSLVETSLVARGAADKPKIVGKSASKLRPAVAQRLAAHGFEDVDRLIVRASLGEDKVDTSKLTADLVEAKTELGVLKASVSHIETARDTAVTRVGELEASLGERDTQITELQAELKTAKDASKAEEADAAVTFLQDVLTKLHTAKGEDVPADLPATVAELTASIKEKTADLTAILPVGGKGVGATGSDTDNKSRKPALLAGFKTNRS